MAELLLPPVDPFLDTARLKGLVRVELHRDGELLDCEIVRNLITQVGDQVYGELGAGIAAAPGAPTGMRLGSGVTAAAKTGAGAAIGTYISGSAQALDAEPGSALNGSSRRITYVVTWAAGTATNGAITEVALTNIAITDAAGSAADTVARAVFTAKDKQADDTLTVTWTHDLLGA
jgi:hypothetical protein